MPNDPTYSVAGVPISPSSLPPDLARNHSFMAALQNPGYPLNIDYRRFVNTYLHMGPFARKILDASIRDDMYRTRSHGMSAEFLASQGIPYHPGNGLDYIKDYLGAKALLSFRRGKLIDYVNYNKGAMGRLKNDIFAPTPPPVRHGDINHLSQIPDATFNRRIDNLIGPHPLGLTGIALDFAKKKTQQGLTSGLGWDLHKWPQYQRLANDLYLYTKIREAIPTPDPAQAAQLEKIRLGLVSKFSPHFGSKTLDDLQRSLGPTLSAPIKNIEAARAMHPDPVVALMSDSSQALRSASGSITPSHRVDYTTMKLPSIPMPRPTQLMAGGAGIGLGAILTGGGVAAYLLAKKHHDAKNSGQQPNAV